MLVFAPNFQKETSHFVSAIFDSKPSKAILLFQANSQYAKASFFITLEQKSISSHKRIQIPKRKRFCMFFLKERLSLRSVT